MGRPQAAEVRSGGSYLSHNDMRVHFGLGDITRVDELRIRWPDGRVEKFEGVDVDGFVEIGKARVSSLTRRHRRIEHRRSDGARLGENGLSSWIPIMLRQRGTWIRRAFSSVLALVSIAAAALVSRPM